MSWGESYINYFYKVSVVPLIAATHQSTNSQLRKAHLFTGYIFWGFFLFCDIFYIGSFGSKKGLVYGGTLDTEMKPGDTCSPF